MMKIKRLIVKMIRFSRKAKNASITAERLYAEAHNAGIGA